MQNGNVISPRSGNKQFQTLVATMPLPYDLNLVTNVTHVKNNSTVIRIPLLTRL